jgi:uncharacterized membrane protein HdeD (DUF308 family)
MDAYQASVQRIEPERRPRDIGPGCVRIGVSRASGVMVHGKHETGAAAVDWDRNQAGPPESALAHRLSALLAIRGLLAVVFGIMVLAWPGITILALAFVFAAYALTDGIGMLVSGMGARGGRRRWSYVLAGALGLLAALAAVLWPGMTVLVLVVWAGAWAVVTGVLEIAASLRSEESSQWLVALAGAFSVVAGVSILIWPGIGAFALATLLGIYALAAGVSYFWAAWQVRSGHAVALAL